MTATLPTSGAQVDHAAPPVSESTEVGDEITLSPAATRAVGVVWVLLGASFAWAVWSRRWMSDDGFINLRIVDNLLSGHGPVFNIGERVEAGTSPLWLAVLALGRVAAGWSLCTEWIAVTLGIACSLAAVGVVAFTQRRAWKSPTLPAALLVWVAIPSVWDFSSSGLETPLLWLWLASAAGLLMIRAVHRPTAAPCQPWWLCVLVGLGPLIRPDAAVYSACFIVVLVALAPSSSRSWRTASRAVGIALALPVAYEVFRAGYFGVLVPNTGLAKEAGSAQWASGFAYLRDALSFGSTWAALVVATALAAVLIRTGMVRPGLRRVWITCWAAAALHLTWVLRVGGDFMHARMILADVLLILLPVATVPLGALRRTPARLGPLLLALLALWAVAVAGTQRVSPRSPYSDSVVDERTAYLSWAGVDHPVELADHRRHIWQHWGESARRSAARGDAVVLIAERPAAALERIPSTGPTAIAWGNIGMLGLSAGHHVIVIDRIGLSDAYAARMDPIPGGRIGHAKWMPLVWIEARYGAAEASIDPRVATARAALECPRLRELHDAVSAPLTPRRFLRNLVQAPALTRLRIPSDPSQAVDELC